MDGSAADLRRSGAPGAHLRSAAVQPAAVARPAAAGSARVFVVVPAYHEERLLPVTIASVPSWVERIVVVDDGSADHTAERALSAGDPRVELVRHAQNRGVGAAIASGYRAAFAAGADVAVVMGADAQMDPADLASLVAPVASGEVGYAKGDRLSHRDCLRAMPRHRIAANLVFTALTRLATGLRIRDSQCGYTALGRAAAAELDVGSLWPRYGYPNDLLGRCAERGIAVRDVVVRPVYGDEESGIRWTDAFVRIPMIIALAARRRRSARRRAQWGK